MGYYPRTDVSQDKNGLLIEVAVPGFDEQNLNIELVSNHLVISGKCAPRDQHATYTTMELYRGSFSRKCLINNKMFDIENVKCKILNGFLTINIPYKNIPHVQEIHKIDIIKGELNGS